MLVLQSLVIALSMYSVIPMPRVDWREDNMRWSLGMLPVVGLVCGAVVAGLCALQAVADWHAVFFAAAAALLPIVLSGGFHIDGFLDAVDAIFSRRDREQRLAIMKDPRCGPFAVLCGAGLLLLETGAWCQLAGKPGLWPAACVVYTLARSLTVLAGSRLPYAPTSKLGALFADRAAAGVRLLGVVEAAVASGGLLLAGFLGAGTSGLLAAAAAALGGWLLFFGYRRMVLEQFGGVTGDLLGFLVELSQLAMLLLLAAGSAFI